MEVGYNAKKTVEARMQFYLDDRFQKQMCSVPQPPTLQCALLLVFCFPKSMLWLINCATLSQKLRTLPSSFCFKCKSAQAQRTNLSWVYQLIG